MLSQSICFAAILRHNRLSDIFQFEARMPGYDDSQDIGKIVALPVQKHFSPAEPGIRFDIFDGYICNFIIFSGLKTASHRVGGHGSLAVCRRRGV